MWLGVRVGQFQGLDAEEGGGRQGGKTCVLLCRPPAPPPARPNMCRLDAFPFPACYSPSAPCSCSGHHPKVTHASSHRLHPPPLPARPSRRRLDGGGNLQSATTQLTAVEASMAVVQANSQLALMTPTVRAASCCESN